MAENQYEVIPDVENAVPIDVNGINLRPLNNAKNMAKLKRSLNVYSSLLLGARTLLGGLTAGGARAIVEGDHVIPNNYSAWKDGHFWGSTATGMFLGSAIFTYTLYPVFAMIDRVKKNHIKAVLKVNDAQAEEILQTRSNELPDLCKPEGSPFSFTQMTFGRLRPFSIGAFPLTLLAFGSFIYLSEQINILSRAGNTGILTSDAIIALGMLVQVSLPTIILNLGLQRLSGGSFSMTYSHLAGISASLMGMVLGGMAADSIGNLAAHLLLPPVVGAASAIAAEVVVGSVQACKENYQSRRMGYALVED